MRLRLARAIAALGLIALCSQAGLPVLAQQPTQEQINAIRSNCRSDFLSNCSGVPRGGPEAVRCLKDHLAKLSPGCNAAVSAITPAPAPKVATPSPAPAPPAAAPAAPAAPPPPTPAATAAPAAPAAPPSAPVTQPATASAPTAPAAPSANKKVQPAPPKSAQPAAPQPNRAAAVAPAAVPPAAAAQPASLLPLPPLAPRVRLMIVRACGAEHRALCANVPAGGGIVECLAEHGDALSPRCRDAILSAR